jgi:hypothetical protein
VATETFGQNLNTPLLAGHSYLLTGYMREAVRADLANPGTYQVELWSSADFTTSDKLVLGTLSPSATNQNAWVLASLGFTAPVGSATHPVLAFRPISGTSAYPGLDNLNLSEAAVALTISINNIPASPTFGGNFTPTYAYTCDGATSVTSNTLGTCTVSSGVVTFAGAGTCTLVAHAAAGVNSPAVDGSPQSFTILQATTTISINNIPGSATFGGNFTPTFAYTGDGSKSVTSNTLSKCTVSGGVVTFAGAGTCTLVAHATAGVNYAAVDGSPQSFTILQATTTISINNIPGSATFGGTFTPTYAYIGDGATSVTSNTLSTCTVSGGVVTFAGAGTCTLVAHAAAGVKYPKS